MKLTKKKTIVLLVMVALLAGVPAGFKYLQVADEITNKVLEYFGILLGGLAGGYLFVATQKRVAGSAAEHKPEAKPQDPQNPPA